MRNFRLLCEDRRSLSLGGGKSALVFLRSSFRGCLESDFDWRATLHVDIVGSFKKEKLGHFFICGKLLPCLCPLASAH